MNINLSRNIVGTSHWSIPVIFDGIEYGEINNDQEEFNFIFQPCCHCDKINQEYLRIILQQLEILNGNNNDN